MTGIELIASERERQRGEEGWTAKHDNQHDGGELAKAACAYAYPEDMVLWRQEGNITIPRAYLWPNDWDNWWKPTPSDRIRELTKAGALIAAEIDRLQRIAS